MRVLQNSEVMTVSGGMIQCEPEADVIPWLMDSGCADNFLDYLYQEFVSLFQWQGC